MLKLPFIFNSSVSSEIMNYIIQFLIFIYVSLQKQYVPCYKKSRL